MALVELGRFNRQEAFIVQGRLEDDGIPSFVFDAGASIADGSYLLIPVRVMVDDEDFDAARAIVAAADLMR
jgi:Putative prokaryotic signal transducing protein